MSSPIDATVYGLFLHAFFLMLIKSNLVPDTVVTFDSKNNFVEKTLHLMKSVIYTKVFYIIIRLTLPYLPLKMGYI
jgi:hypothetical protein